MASVRQISKRIRSVQNTAKITKAMSMIAASKLRRSQDSATQGRFYTDNIRNMVSNVMSQIGDEIVSQPLTQIRDVENIGVLFITPDRGLTGGLNSNLIREFDSFVSNQKSPVKVVGIGKKGLDYSRRNSLEIIGSIVGISDKPNPVETSKIADILINEYKEGGIDSVYICYSQFINTTLQKPILSPLLPITADFLTVTNNEYIYEPTASIVLSNLLPRYVQTLVHHAVLEANASEQSARMVAMNQATDNANEMVDDLTLLMNKMRQEMITNELLDIVGGVSALEA
jgi:F-type H+-transporting ATPase subunit gamma